MDDARRRDGLLAVGVLAATVGLLRYRDASGALADPRAALAGIGTALAAEWAFLRYPDALLALWERPAVNRGSTLGLAAAAVTLRRHHRLLAACCWGLLTYLGLLGGLLVRRNFWY